MTWWMWLLTPVALYLYGLIGFGIGVYLWKTYTSVEGHFSKIPKVKRFILWPIASLIGDDTNLTIYDWFRAPHGGKNDYLENMSILWPFRVIWTIFGYFVAALLYIALWPMRFVARVLVSIFRFFYRLLSRPFKWLESFISKSK
jgi:hypothetical protein